MLWSIKKLQLECMCWVKSFPLEAEECCARDLRATKGRLSNNVQRCAGRAQPEQKISDPWFWVTGAINYTGGGKKERGLFSRIYSAVQWSFSQAMPFPAGKQTTSMLVPWRDIVEASAVELCAGSGSLKQHGHWPRQFQPLWPSPYVASRILDCGPMCWSGTRSQNDTWIQICLQNHTTRHLCIAVYADKQLTVQEVMVCSVSVWGNGMGSLRYLCSGIWCAQK